MVRKSVVLALLAMLLGPLSAAPLANELPTPSAPRVARLKDVTEIEGIRDNQLIGYGLVVGLNGTGDKQQTIFSVQTLEQSAAHGHQYSRSDLYDSSAQYRRGFCNCYLATVFPARDENRCHRLVDRRRKKSGGRHSAAYAAQRARWQSVRRGARSSGDWWLRCWLVGERQDRKSSYGGAYS